MKSAAFILLLLPCIFANAQDAAQLRALAKNDSVDVLCMIQLIKPEYGDIARAELAERKSTCDWERTKMQVSLHFQQQQQKQQVKNDAAANQATLRMQQLELEKLQTQQRFLEEQSKLQREAEQQRALMDAAKFFNSMGQPRRN